MLSTSFSALVPLKKGRSHLRTQIPSTPSETMAEHSWESIWSVIVEWSVFAYEGHLDEEPVASTSTAPDLPANFLWSILVSLQLMHGSVDDEDVSTRAVRLGDDLVVRKSDRGYMAQMATVDGLAALALRLRHLVPLDKPPDRPPKRKQLADAGTDARQSQSIAPPPSIDSNLYHRVALLEKRVADLSLRPSPPDAKLASNPVALIVAAIALVLLALR